MTSKRELIFDTILFDTRLSIADTPRPLGVVKGYLNPDDELVDLEVTLNKEMSDDIKQVNEHHDILALGFAGYLITPNVTYKENE